MTFSKISRWFQISNWFLAFRLDPLKLIPYTATTVVYQKWNLLMLFPASNPSKLPHPPVKQDLCPLAQYPGASAWAGLCFITSVPPSHIDIAATGTVCDFSHTLHNLLSSFWSTQLHGQFFLHATLKPRSIRETPIYLQESFPYQTLLWIPHTSLGDVPSSAPVECPLESYLCCCSRVIIQGSAVPFRLQVHWRQNKPHSLLFIYKYYIMKKWNWWWKVKEYPVVSPGP